MNKQRKSKTAAGIGHDQEGKPEATLRLPNATGEYISAGGQEPDEQAKLLNGLGFAVSGQGAGGVINN